VSVLCFKTILEQDSIHNEILVPPRQNCVGLKKAWYKRIFNLVNYCQYSVHNL